MNNFFYGVMIICQLSIMYLSQYLNLLLAYVTIYFIGHTFPFYTIGLAGLFIGLGEIFGKLKLTSLHCCHCSSTHTHTHAHAHTHAHTHTHTCAHAPVHTHTHTHTCKHTHAHGHAHTRVCMHTHIQMHTRTHAHTNTQVGVSLVF